MRVVVVVQNNPNLVCSLIDVVCFEKVEICGDVT